MAATRVEGTSFPDTRLISRTPVQAAWSPSREAMLRVVYNPPSVHMSSQVYQHLMQEVLAYERDRSNLPLTYWEIDMLRRMPAPKHMPRELLDAPPSLAEDPPPPYSLTADNTPPPYEPGCCTDSFITTATRYRPSIPTQTSTRIRPARTIALVILSTVPCT